MSDLLQKYGQKLGSATFQGKLFDAGSFPAAVAADSESHKVHGELYEVDDSDSLFSQLDPYEGYEPQNHTESLFLRQKVIVQLKEKEVGAWIYLYNRPVDNLKPIHEGDYLSYLKA